MSCIFVHLAARVKKNEEPAKIGIQTFQRSVQNSRKSCRVYIEPRAT